MALLKKGEEALYKILVLASSFFFIGFEAVRAARAPLTYDEANTYLSFISSNILAIFNFNTANNHFLNSLLAKIVSAMAGTSEFALRLPNLLSYAAYLLFAFLILDRFVKTKIIVLCGYLLLSLNPFVLDYFSLCRGYGLSLGLLMASLFFFFSFLDKELGRKPDAYRYLQFSLTALGFGILANFSLLNVYLSLVVFAFGFLIVVNRKDRRGLASARPAQSQTVSKKFLWPLLALTAIVFNLLVISQDFSVADKLFEPVAVRITGLSQQDRQDMHILRIDIQDRKEELLPQNGLWRLAKPAYFTALEFRCPPGLIGKIKRLEIRIGRKNFVYDSADIKKFKIVRIQGYAVFSSKPAASLKRSIIPAYSPVINWKGDQALLVLALRRLLLPLGLWGMAAVILSLLGRFLDRRKILARDQFQPLAGTTFVLAVFTGFPLYILKTSGALWLGGSSGFVRDTVFSLINNSFYGNLYVRGQEWLVLSFLGLFLIAFLIVVIVHGRRKSLADILAGFSVLAFLLLSSVSTVIQRIGLGTPYLVGRTALFLIPLGTLLLIFLFKDLARWKAGLKIISLALLVVLTLLSLYHFSAHASTAVTAEWRKNADTRTLLKDLQEIREKSLGGKTKIILGIDDVFYPSLQYYLKRGSAAWLDIRIVPPYQGSHFYYLNDTVDSPRTGSLDMILIKAYPRSGTILMKPRPE
jgi:hypothetical protein